MEHAASDRVIVEVTACIVMKSPRVLIQSSIKKCRERLELLFVIGLICVILPLFSIPIILRLISRSRVSFIKYTALMGLQLNISYRIVTDYNVTW